MYKLILIVLAVLLSTPTKAVDSGCEAGLYTYEAMIINRSNGKDGVYDGDTVWLKVRLGFGIEYELGPTRLYGINAPEMRGEESAKGRESRDFISSILPRNQWFMINSIKDEKGKYGRYLVVLCPGGVNVNQLLVSKGYAEKRVYK